MRHSHGAQDGPGPGDVGLVLWKAGEKLSDVLGLEAMGKAAADLLKIRRPQGAVFTMDSVSRA